MRWLKSFRLQLNPSYKNLHYRRVHVHALNLILIYCDFSFILKTYSQFTIRIGIHCSCSVFHIKQYAELALSIKFVNLAHIKGNRHKDLHKIICCYIYTETPDRLHVTQTPTKKFHRVETGYYGNLKNKIVRFELCIVLR